MPHMKVLVTGGAGFIGSHLVDRLVEQGHRVRILDNLRKPVHTNRIPDYLNKEAEFLYGDVRLKSDWERALKDIDVVFHLAAYQDYLQDFSTFFHTNTVGTAILFEVAVERGLEFHRIIIGSSQAVYGEGKYICQKDGIQYPDIRLKKDLDQGRWDILCPICGEKMDPDWTDESRVNPVNQYAMSKYTQEMIAFSMAKRYNFPVTALRFSIVQGPRQSFYNAYSGACRIFSLSCFFDRAPVVFEDGMQIRDFVNIEDVIDACMIVMDHPDAPGRSFNVGSGKKYRIIDFARMVIEEFGKDFEPVVPGKYRFGDTRHIFSDISAIKKLGYNPKRDAKYSIKKYREYIESDRKSLDDYATLFLEQMEKMGVVLSVKK